MKLPPPVTNKSSKKNLWEELECARAEIDAQQAVINARREENDILNTQVSALRYQISVIQAVLNGRVP